ncbi:MAG: hypothetical protein DI630_12050 [Gordonia sp. (in: high G+C Gram-positive bacteria)]|nr:MAG: hypothetical protein DI630_12050 [Gordonia sp. (in: high G+C Gram-positive bacteria)]
MHRSAPDRDIDENNVVIAEPKLAAVSSWTADTGLLQERTALDFRIVNYPTPRRNAAAYYPETIGPVPLDRVARKSISPVSKAIIVGLERAAVAVGS